MCAMRVGVYQFASTDNIENNLNVICDAAKKACNEQVRLLVLHECALCGYPPVETKIENVDPKDIEKALIKIEALAEKYRMYIAVGTIRFVKEKRYNSIVVISDTGKMIGVYDKKALWGWDRENFSEGTASGIFKIDNLRIGFRICFDIRFPELFRELYKENTDICFVSFSDTSQTDNIDRRNVIKSHLVTRAAENVMTIISVNSISNFQTAPTAVFDCDGNILQEAPLNEENLLIYDFEKPEITFGRKGRIVNNNKFL